MDSKHKDRQETFRTVAATVFTTELDASTNSTSNRYARHVVMYASVIREHGELIRLLLMLLPIANNSNNNKDRVDRSSIKRTTTTRQRRILLRFWLSLSVGLITFESSGDHGSVLPSTLHFSSPGIPPMSGEHVSPNAAHPLPLGHLTASAYINYLSQDIRVTAADLSKTPSSAEDFQRITSQAFVSL